MTFSNYCTKLLQDSKSTLTMNICQYEFNIVYRMPLGP